MDPYNTGDAHRAATATEATQGTQGTQSPADTIVVDA
jgi:hypothetical protein